MSGGPVRGGVRTTDFDPFRTLFVIRIMACAKLYFFLCEAVLRVQHSQGRGALRSPLSARIAIFILGVQHSQGWGTPSSPLSVIIAIFILGVQHSQGWGAPSSPLSASVVKSSIRGWGGRLAEVV